MHNYCSKNAIIILVLYMQLDFLHSLTFKQSATFPIHGSISC